MAIRIDKYIWCVRLAKTRTLASELVAKGKIKVNKSSTKPGKDVKVGDLISLSKNAAVFEYKVLALLDKRVGTQLVGLYLKDNTPPAEIEKYKLYQQSQAAYREKGNGKPSGKDRRDLDSFFSWDGDDSNED